MRITVLSPHRDDAAFSCGLTLRSLLLAGNNLAIVNVCTISRYAPYFTKSTGDLMQEVTGLRRKEDTAFVEKLRHTAGAESGHVELVDLEWQDVPLRWCMEKDEQALAPLNLPPQEVQELVNVFCALRTSDVVLVPMALGGHVDHRLVLEAARQALPVSSLVLYEDLPYACRMSARERTSSGFQPDVPLSEVWLPLLNTVPGLKREYALCYPSQIAVDVADEMERYATEHGGRERFLAGPNAMRKLQTASQYEVAL